jgi:hypothetical protein
MDEVEERRESYLYRQWVVLCGPGWSTGEVRFGMAACTVLGVGIALYAWMADWGWSPLQIGVVGLLAWDLAGGAIGYNSTHMKRHRFPEERILPPLHHNLQHIHPLIVALFQTQWLLWVFLYWLATFFLYAELLEPGAEGKRKLGPTGEVGVVVVELMVGAVLTAAAFIAEGATPALGAYGATVYFGIALLTVVVHFTPVRMQRTVAALCVILMCFASGTLLSIPAGFAWLIPVYGIKLLLGYTAREPLRPESLATTG